MECIARFVKRIVVTERNKLLSGWLKVLGYNVVITLALAGVLLVGLEVWLRTNGKFDGLANADLRASNTVWTRYPNSEDTDRHPDLQIPIVLMYDGLGARNHSDVDVSKWRNLVAVFGDSYTENRQVDVRFTFHAIINDILGENRVANFGVNGFGLEQSIQRYINLRESVDIETVVYIFCANDIRNTYEVSLFDPGALESEGVFTNTLAQSASSHEKARQLFIRIISRLHVTYFILESKNAIRHRFLNKQDRDTSLLAGKLHDDDTQSEREWRRLFKGGYADDLVQHYLRGSASPDELEIVNKFRLLLQRWAEMVQSDGAKFIVAPVYGDLDRALLQRLIVDTKVESMYLDLPRTQEIEFLRGYDNHFENDDHWNEMGNLAVAYGLLNAVTDIDNISAIGRFTLYRDKIVDYYSRGKLYPRPAKATVSAK